jgi:adenylylsulfate kinase
VKIEPFAVWLTGLPGSGKSVISERLNHLLKEEGIESQILRMDKMREYVTPEPKYTDDERQLIYNAFAYSAKLLVENDINVIMDATGNRRKYRSLAKEIIPNFSEIFLNCPLEVAMKREMNRKDTKNAPQDIYERAQKGETETVPGLQVEYEEPLKPDLVINTHKYQINECAKQIISFLLG